MSKPEASFDTAREFLLRAVQRSAFGTKGLASFAGGGIALGGAPIVLVAAWVDGVLGGKIGPVSIMGWVLYCLLLMWVLLMCKNPSLVAGTPYWRGRWFVYGVIQVRITGLGAAVFLSPSIATLVIALGMLEVLCFVLWVGGLRFLLANKQEPFSVSHALMGSWCPCNERDMVLDALLTGAWWANMPDGDKKAIWDALPDWKWELHTYVLGKEILGQYDFQVALRVQTWMDMESHPYWCVVRGMYGNDLVTSVRVFLDARDGVGREEHYDFAF